MFRAKPYESYYKLRLKYGSATPKPWKLLTINPDDIVGVSTPPFFKESHSYTEIDVVGGEWDIIDPDRKIGVKRDGYEPASAIPFTTENWGWYRSIKKYVEQGVKWKDTEAHEFYVKNNSQSRSEYRQKKIDRLHESIQKSGYKTPSELANSKEDYPPSIRHENHNTIIVNIGRDGSYILEDGKNRSCLAKLLDVESVAVRVLVRHEEWQSIRSEVSNADSIDRLSEKARRQLDHPDLRDVRPGRSKNDQP